MKRLLLPLILSSALLSSCAQYATVTERRAHYHPVQSATGAQLDIQQHIVTGSKIERRDPEKAIGAYLDAAYVASRQLQKNPGDTTARDSYNFAIARIFTAIKEGDVDLWTKKQRIKGASEDYVIGHRAPKIKAGDPSLYEFTPADQFDVKGSYVTERTIKPGLGAPIVAVGKDKRDDAAVMYAPTRTFYGVTAVAHFASAKDASGARPVTISFEDPLNVENVTMDGHTYPLGADFTVPLAVMLARENPKKLEIARVLRPEKYAETAHISRLQPYDPNKTVVIVTHGLMDSPATWTPMLNTLRGDPFIRDHYQFWFYSYPSGYPYPYSAAIMRRELDGIEKRFPIKKPAVLIGHSMGSLISRLMITDSGDEIWMKTFGKEPDQMKLAPKTRQMLTDALIFRHRPEVGRVIFISGPHRGSEIASNWVGRFASSLVKAPLSLAKIGTEMKSAMLADSSALRLRGIPNSVDTLAPNNRFVKIINTIPLTKGIPYHSIIGDRGKGGNKDKTPPVSSDGVVPYWSSHLVGAQSELIVPSPHGAHQNKQAIAEVRRILYLNAGSKVSQ